MIIDNQCIKHKQALSFSGGIVTDIAMVLNQRTSQVMAWASGRGTATGSEACESDEWLCDGP